MRIRKLILLFALMLFSQFSYSADYFYSNDDFSAVNACRNAITTVNNYYCTMSLYSSYLNTGNGQYRLGYLQLKSSSGSVINTYYYGTLSYSINWSVSCNQIPDLDFYSSFSSSPSQHCTGDPSALRICPASASWSFNSSTNQCIYAGSSGETDGDGDGVMDNVDNCPSTPNANQADADQDGVGDVCESQSDVDGDEVPDLSDNCPNDSNADQANADNDAFGDVCDSTPNGPDGDSDGSPDSSDNCPLDANPGQSDADSDGIGDACDACNAGDYSNHQEFPSDTISSSIPSTYCNSNNCTMNKYGQNCSNGVCYVDYLSSGVSCSPDSTPSNWSQYFTTAPDTSGFNLAADNSAFILNNGSSALTGLNNNYKFIITNCVRSSNTDVNGMNWNTNTIGCPNFTLLNVCSTTAEIDAYLQQYIINNPFQTTVYQGSNSSVYYKPTLTSVKGDGLFGTDSGDGNYFVQVVVTEYLSKQLSSGSYSEIPIHATLVPMKLALTGCTSNATGGTGGTGGTGPSGTYEFNSGGSFAGFGTEATDALVTAQTELTDTLNTIKSEFNTYIYGTCGTDVNGDPILDEMGNPVSCSFGLAAGSAELPTFEIGTVKGVDVTVDWTKWTDPLLSVGNAIVVLAALLAFSIIF